MDQNNDTIVALATGVGGALAVIRLSGAEAIKICDSVFKAASGNPLSSAKGYTLHYGEIKDSDGSSVDEVLISVFHAPHSYTGEDSIEISCHASRYIGQRIISLLIDAGARHATPGEFTIRAYMNGKMDLAQAEAVADIIASTDRATHAMALTQMRGGYSAEFKCLRDRLLNLVSLMELELDFGEEEVEFADRSKLLSLTDEIKTKVDQLLKSFRHGNAIKEGIGVAIVGAPNVGKSTLLNTLLKDDRAMVSDIAGTTRDAIEETLNINGVRFRFIDTAGIRNTDDTLEQMGIERTYVHIDRAEIVIVMAEAGDTAQSSANNIHDILSRVDIRPEQNLCILLNKADKQGLTESTEYPAQITPSAIRPYLDIDAKIIPISAKNNINISSVSEYLYNTSDACSIFRGDPIVSNSRHYESLSRASESLSRVHEGLQTNLPADLISQDIRETLYHLGTITGEITTDDILSQIFSKFCIGK